MFDFQDKRGLLTLGWVRPSSVTPFLALRSPNLPLKRPHPTTTSNAASLPLLTVILKLTLSLLCYCILASSFPTTTRSTPTQPSPASSPLSTSTPTQDISACCPRRSRSFALH